MAVPRRGLRLLAACRAALALVAAVGAGPDEGARAAGAKETADPAPSPPPEHYWAYARGKHGQYMTTNETMPRDIASAFSWNWYFPEGRYRTIVRGTPLIDSEKNVLILTEQGLFKLDQHGRFLWHYLANPQIPMNVVPCIDGDRVYGMAMDATVYALDLKTGKELWRQRYSPWVGPDTHYVEAHDGILLTAVDVSTRHTGGNLRVMALNTTHGGQLWEYRIDIPTWNFSPLFPGDGTFIFMDLSGGVHRVRHRTGERVWFSPPPPPFEHSFTDGGVGLGPDGTAFACSSRATDDKGALRAYRFEDGKLLWDKHLPTGCTSWPAIHHSGEWGVLPIGHFVGSGVALDLPKFVPYLFRSLSHQLSLAMGPHLRKLPGFGWIRKLHTEVIAFSTKSGMTLWSYRTPDWEREAAMGDEEGLTERLTHGRSAICLPTSWSTPTLSGDNTVYAGHASGVLYAVGDHDGNGEIDPETEVFTYDMGGAPLPNSPTFAPGMMVMASCDGLFVFKK